MMSLYTEGVIRPSRAFDPGGYPALENDGNIGVCPSYEL
jgi:hypothetical protein